MCVLDVLPEVADVATDFFPWFEGEGDYWNEAKGEPFPRRSCVSIAGSLRKLYVACDS
jgi:hypothetical protein